MNKTGEALWNIRAAMLLFLIDINLFGFDIVPDFVGWLCLLSAVGALKKTIPGLERIYRFGEVLFAFELLLAVQPYVGSAMLDRTISFLSIFICCIRIYFMYVLLTAAADAAAGEGGTAETVRKLCRDRNGILLAELALNLAAAVKGVEQVSGILWIPTVLYFFFYICAILHLTFLREDVEKEKKTEEKTEEAEIS